MIALEISLNQRRLCLAGTDASGGVTAMVNFYPRPRRGRSAGARHRASGPELALSVYGIEIPDPDTDRFLRWVNRRTLRIGDEIRIRLAKSEGADRPRSIRVFRRVERDAGERTYYERLKKKFEGPKRAHRKR